ncbi:MLX-interacting protein-like isoform X2 [Rhinatrema bivittatum]|uniref:MLX-interacting protein-like isoform X2 n=1 Tax=Rhinatrema bivittatum TaxID=194408 RepID=UPI0011269F1F|nr:MLX-interacting protein-like isoform X2 [Rhinatrema bivittatum]
MRPEREKPRMPRPQIIHSGHFMVSEPHADPDPVLSPTGGEGDEGEEKTLPSVTVVDHEKAGLLITSAVPGHGREGQRVKNAGAYDFDTVNMRTCQIYRFGPRSSGYLNIDASLTKLFECMTLAYSGKIVSPKWKTFKGLKLLQRDKIRLNNAIWRAWYLQYVERRKNPVCNFVTPLEASDVDFHRKPEAVVVEGKYWKRQIEVVIREYHKWRTYSKALFRKKKHKPVSTFTQSEYDPLQGFGDLACPDFPMDLDPLHDLDILIAEFTDTLFSTRNPYGGPSPCEFVPLGNADMIQPSLSQLHPNLGDEFMDTLEPINDFFAASRSLPLSTSLSSSQTPSLPDVALESLPLHRESEIPSFIVNPIGMASKVDPSLASAASMTPVPFPLELNSLGHLNGHQTLLPFFSSSPVTLSPPVPMQLPEPTPQGATFQLQPPPTIMYQPPLFSMIMHSPALAVPAGDSPAAAAGIDPSPGQSSSGGTFAVPMSGPPVRRSSDGRSRQFIKIAPRSEAKPPIGTGSAFMTHLVVRAPAAPQSLLPARNSSQVCELSNLSSTVLVNAAPRTEKADVPLSIRAATADFKPDEEAVTEEESTSSSLRQSAAKGRWRPTPTFADQARRMKISCGLKVLASLVLPVHGQPSAKMTKAALLEKSVGYITRLQQERRRMLESTQQLRTEMEELNAAISTYQQQLPITGAPVVVQHSDHMTQLYDSYVRSRTLQNWKFWIFSIIIKPLFETYQKTVSTSSLDEFCHSVLTWLEQHCTLPILRPAMLGCLLQLSKITSILSNPSRVPEQARQAVLRGSQNKGHS